MNTSSGNNSSSGNDSIYLVDSEGPCVEVERAIGISVMGVGGDGGGIFSPDYVKKQVSGGSEDFKKQWLKWLRESFRDQMSAAFVKVYMASMEMRVESIVKLDNELDLLLSVIDNERSREAGKWFLEGKSEMQRAPQWQKYARYVDQGACPGHVVVVFALQAALYHLPLLHALTSYVYFEWRAGMLAYGKQRGIASGDVSPREFQEKYAESLKVVREVFARDLQAERSISSL